MTRPKMTELIVVVLLIAGIGWRDKLGLNFDNLEAIGAAVAAAGYAISRGIAKSGAGGQARAKKEGVLGILGIVGAVSLLSAPAAFAARGLTPDRIASGTSTDWIDRGNGSEAITQLQLAFSYDVVWTSRFGATAEQFVSVAPGSSGDSENDWITESRLPAWLTFFDGNLETFLGPAWSRWGANITGEAESLYGLYGGIRFPVDYADLDGDGVEESVSLWFQAAGKIYTDFDDLRQGGMTFATAFAIP